MHIAIPARGKKLTLALLAIAAFAAAAVVLLGHSATPAPADTNPNNYDCRGGIEKGAVDPDTGETQIHYLFACNGRITGFQVAPQIQATGFDTEVFGTDKATGQVDGANDAFSCQGDIPSYGINCVGKYKGGYDVINGTFTIDGNVCNEPRVDPLLTVTYASAVAATAPATAPVVTQAISGPFDLGRPRKAGCKTTLFSGKTRIPVETSEDASTSDVG